MVHQRKPCSRCGRPKRPGIGVRTCGQCRPVDAVWDRLETGPGDCWLWTGSVDEDGYGRYSRDGLVHRMVYQFLVVDIPSDLDLDHLCLVKRCANPWHLEPVSRGENSRRKNALISRCKNDHPFTDENTYYVREGAYLRRHCRTCNAAAQQRYQQRKKVAC